MHLVQIFSSLLLNLPPNNCAFFDCSMLHSLSTFKLHFSHFSATYYVVFYVLLLALTLLAAIVLVPWSSWLVFLEKQKKHFQIV